MSHPETLTKKVDNPQCQCVYDLIDAQFQRNPEFIAIAAPERHPLSYGLLRTFVEGVVNTLNSMGIGRNDRVAMVLPNGPEMAVAFLAVTACATSAPLNPSYRATEFEFYISDLNAKALIVQAGLNSPAVEVAKKHKIPIIELTPMLKAAAGIFSLKGENSSREVRNGFARSDDVALLLHTSGTTSQPKIVPLTQTNICTSAHNIKVTLRLVNSDRCLNIMPLFHIHGLTGALISSLVAGASIVCSPGLNVVKFYEWIKVFSPTWYSAVPTMHQAILAHASKNKEIIKTRPLRFIRSSSSALPPTVMKELEETFGTPVIEAYGMTEASHQVTSNPLPPLERKPGSVGIAAGPEVGIMDYAGNHLLQGEIGEIVIRGANVTSGYEKNVDANKKAFTNFWFRTGDLGFLDAENYLYIKGRHKELINRGGEKVFPREVDEAIMKHPAVSQAITFAVPHKTLGEDVIAAVVLNDESIANEQEIRETAFEELSDFKVPSRIIFVDEIPKGSTGKLQRIGMAEKFASKLKAEFVEPKSPVEKELAGIWIEVLGINKIGVDDNFFVLGGDSLLAASVVSRVQKIFQIELPLVNIFRDPTLVRQALRIEEIILEEIEKFPESEAQRLWEQSNK